MHHPQIIDFNITMKNKTFMDVHFSFVRNVAQLLIDLVVLHDSGNGTFDMIYTNKTVDVCKFLINKKMNIFFEIMVNIMSDYVVIPNRCPIRKVTLIFCKCLLCIASFNPSQKKYEMLNVFIDPEKFPPFMPDHRARVSIFGWHREKNVKKILAQFKFDLVIERAYKIN